MARIRTSYGPSYAPGSVLKTQGFIWNYQQSASAPRSYDRCEDIVGDSLDGHFLNIEKFRVEASPCFLSKPGYWANCNNFYSSAAVLAGPDTTIFPDMPTDDYIAVKTMAGTNPSRPVVDVPVAVLELGDTVSTIHALFSKSAKLFTSYSKAGKAAEANLLYQFEIRPLVNDIVTVLDFSEHVDKRVQEFERIIKNKGISRVYRKKQPFNSSVTQRNDNYSVNSSGSGPTLRAVMELNARQDAWGFAKWEPYPGHPFPKNAAAMRRLARKAILGLTIDFSTAWELIPFSWLVDYGFGIGAYFAAHRNLVPVFCSQLYVCRHSTYVRSFSQATDENLVCPSWKVHTERKTRRPIGFTTPAAQLPFLNGGQMSIIASLGVLKVR